MFILIVVFVSGFMVMALEIVALRAVYAGISSDIYATGAVIGVILTALSLGYWLGGNLTLYYNPRLIQSIALIIAGIWIFMIAGIPGSISEFFTRVQPIEPQAVAILESPWRSVPGWVVSAPLSDSMFLRQRVDPLIASMILFFIPSVFLAMIGPCAVKILTHRAEDAGRISGWIFALGSLGSIAGVISTSFFLISAIGTSAIFRLIGLLTAILGIALRAARDK